MEGGLEAVATVLTAPQQGRWQTVAENDRENGDFALIAALAAGVGVRKAAKTTGLSERTVYRRLDNPGFRRRVDEARDRLLSETLGRLVDASTAAVDALRDLLATGSDEMRWRAAKSILECITRVQQGRETTTVKVGVNVGIPTIQEVVVADRDEAVAFSEWQRRLAAANGETRNNGEGG